MLAHLWTTRATDHLAQLNVAQVGPRMIAVIDRRLDDDEMSRQINANRQCACAHLISHLLLFKILT